MLRGANLSGANLWNADLLYTDLSGADLTRVVLSGARLNYADLSGANLHSTDLSSVILGHATCHASLLVDTNLSQALDLEKVQHRGPSSIGTDTLEKTAAGLSANPSNRGPVETFLRGCGLSDWEIEAAKLYDPKLSEEEINLHMYEMVRLRGEQPIMHTRLFISYSHKDADFVEAFEPLLDSKGVRYWRDVHDMRAGRMETQIDRGITLNPLVLLILSADSVRSDWVEDEATKARELERQYRDQGHPRDVLCPVALDDAWKRSDWPRWLRRQIEDYNILDFSGWKNEDLLKAQFAKLYEGILLNYQPAPSALGDGDDGES